jgi:hypothetical protein
MEFRKLAPGDPVPEGWTEVLGTRRGRYIARQGDVVMKASKIVRDKTQRRSVKAAKPVKKPLSFANKPLFAPTAATSVAAIRAESEDEDDEMEDLASRMASTSMGIQVSLDDLKEALKEEDASKSQEELVDMLKSMGLNPEWGGEEGGRRHRKKTRKNKNKKRRTTRRR